MPFFVTYVSNDPRSLILVKYCCVLCMLLWHNSRHLCLMLWNVISLSLRQQCSRTAAKWLQLSKRNSQ